jgi:hypothetical protein
MSRPYNMDVEITEHDPARSHAITAAADAEWSFGEWSEGERLDAAELLLTASGDGWLCGGESEAQFTERLSLAIWKANGCYCKVVVSATLLEMQPYKTHSLDQSDYERLMMQAKTEAP